MNVLRRDRAGSVAMIHTVTILFLLILSGMAFMKWAANENQQANFELARIRAYYAAQHGIFEKALSDMRTRTPETMPTTGEHLGEGVMNLSDSQEIASRSARYTDVYIYRPTIDASDESLFSSSYRYDLSAIGHANYVTPEGAIKTVSRKVILRTKLRTYASYMYLTKFELTRFNEIIWFWQRDTLNGRVHSNDFIGIKNRPVFLGPISTSESEFIESSANPYFAYPPVFDAPEVHFPETADVLRSSAGSQGLFFQNNNGRWQSRLSQPRGGGGLLLEQWVAGIPYDSNNVENTASVTFGNEVAVFVEGDCELMANDITGTITIGTSGHLELMDNVKITDASPDEYDVHDSYSIVGLISEKNVVIRDTYANGRANSSQDQDIVITAAIVALGESFTFEHQNDNNSQVQDTYVFCTGANSGSTDERGAIILRGAVTQLRRGYVHRSNCGGTGYDKDYKYDFRLDSTPPPAYLEAKDENGSALFDVISWEEEKPDPNTP